MEHTLYLSKAMGIALVLIGLVIMARRRYFIPVFATYAESRLVRTVASMIELFAGTFLVVAHNVWSPLPAAIVSIIGWMVLLEGLLYLLLPDDLVGKFIATFNTPAWYLAGGSLAVIVGIYLAGHGCGWW